MSFIKEHSELSDSVLLSLQVFSARAKFPPLGSLRAALVAPVLHPSFVCHSEERSDEESAFGFPILVERVEKKAKQMLHFVQHDTTANSEHREGFRFL